MAQGFGNLRGSLRPKNGFANYFHFGLTAILPALVYVLVRTDFAQVALAIILLSKWRMFAVRPRHWWPHIRANAIDIIAGLSFLAFMVEASPNASWQIFWALSYGIWLLFIKPGNSVMMVSTQAILGQLLGLTSLFLVWESAPLIGLVASVWGICYVSARHYFMSFDEQYTSLMSHSWAYFSSALTWLLGHWLLFYGFIAQPTLLLSVLAVGLVTLFYLDQTDRLSVLVRRQFVFIMVAIVVVVLAFSDWGDKTV